MFERFTDHARRVIVMAQEEARLLHHHDIRAEHLLLGLLQVDDDETVGRVLGVSLAGAQQAVAAASPPESSASSGHIPFTKNAKRAMELASDESRRRHAPIGPGLLLVGLMSVRDQQTEDVLTSLGVDLDEARAAARALVDDGTGSGRQPGPRAGDDPPAGTFASHPRDSGPHRDALAAALHRYGQHDEGCPATATSCTCGFGAALAEADGGPQPS